MASSQTAVSVRGLSKSYTIAHEAQKHTLATEAFLHSLKNFGRKPETETFWALKDVSFDINKGDVVGIIGRNGAGKSTLLKVLSRITEPTAGQIELYGRVGSLLEVGTGFHPELTGRENVYLNGAVLGMSRREIARHFDAIVDFAGVEKFLDTPVKRYSSGMYVRLAFAVAAHLEPEILIVDEVLAVGDASFQKKCLGKMQDVAAHGRTVLFVSHNTASIRTLCTRGLFLKDGALMLDTDIDRVVDEYLSADDHSDALVVWDADDPIQTPELRFLQAYIANSNDEVVVNIDYRKSFSIVVEYELLKPVRGLSLGVIMHNHEGITICGSTDTGAWSAEVREPGVYVSACSFPGYLLNSGGYLIGFGADAMSHTQQIARTPLCLRMTVEDLDGHIGVQKLPGVIKPQLLWNVQEKTAPVR